MLLAASLAGCATTANYEAPIPVMTAGEAPTERLAAARQAERDFPDDPRRIAKLHHMLWDRGYNAKERRYAIDQLIAHDEAAFKEALSRRIVLVQNWDTIRYLCELAVQRGWRDMTPTLVRQYARPVHGMGTEDRPSREAIEKLNPGKTVTQVIFEVFADSDDDVSIKEQVAAWELLTRISEPGELMDRLAAAPDATPLVIDLKASARDLQTLPINKEGVLRLQYLRSPAQAKYWEQYKQLVASLDVSQKKGLRLRHLPILAHLSERERQWSRAKFAATIDAMLDGVEHHLKNPTYGGGNRDYPQKFHEYRDQMAWADLATVYVLNRAARNRAVVRSLFEQAEKDEQDTSTEYGGVLLHVDGRYVAKAYPPLIRHHDLKFIPRPEMIEASYTGLAHYHFHAQDFRNRDYAGPASGDLKLADRLQLHGLVFTFIDRDTLNVDYYDHHGVVIDMGELKR